MRVRRLTLLIAFYITLDFGSPFIAGAFTFNADESVDGVHAHRQQVKVKAVSVPMPLPERAENKRVPTLAPPRHEVRPLAEWFVDLRRAHSPTAASPLVSEDH
jgi:hypothetical protein